MTRIDGKKIAEQAGAGLAGRIERLAAAGVTPAMAIVVATADDGAAWYVRSLTRAAGRLGIEARQVTLGTGASLGDIQRTLAGASADPGTHGVILQTPLPDGVKLERAASAIDPDSDIDGANPVSLGRLAAGAGEAFAPATAAAVMEILRREEVPLLGRRAVVVGRSNVVGKPAALLLLREHATVTICHSRTADLAAVTREADVLVVTVGQPKLVTAAHVKPGAVVIDVGTNPTPDGGLTGDVDTDAVEAVASAITPVPGGVGPVTTMTLMSHLVTAAERGAGLA